VNGVVPVVEGRLYALTGVYELDGLVASHPRDARGFSTMNCYLLIDDHEALLINTGFSVHQNLVLGGLTELVGDRALSLAICRPEFCSMCNVRPIADAFDLKMIHQLNPVHPSRFQNFRPEFSGVGRLEGVDYGPLRNGMEIDIGRRIDVLLPMIRLLPTPWLFDHETRTLFTGDVFCWNWEAVADGPLAANGWLLGDPSLDECTVEHVGEALLGARYWWLAGADTRPLREWLDGTFARYEVDFVAPDHGAILGGACVDRHRRLLAEFLESTSGVLA
jgi:hypothetical protein